MLRGVPLADLLCDLRERLSSDGPDFVAARGQRRQPGQLAHLLRSGIAVETVECNLPRLVGLFAAASRFRIVLYRFRYSVVEICGLDAGTFAGL
jgi:hypothetical protein